MMFQSKMRCPLEPCCAQLGKDRLMETFHRPLASMIICWTLSCWKTKLLCSLLGEFGDCILAVGLDDAVGKAVLHDKSFQMLKLMPCWPFSGRDDRAAQAGDGLHHCQDDDALRLLGQNCCCCMRVVHETVVQLYCAMLMLMSMMMPTTSF